MRLNRRQRLVRVLDDWAHYHRFDWRWLCDIDERLKGMPRHVVRQRHRIEALTEIRNVHAVGKSYRQHPSQVDA